MNSQKQINHNLSEGIEFKQIDDSTLFLNLFDKTTGFNEFIFKPTEHGKSFLTDDIVQTYIALKISLKPRRLWALRLMGIGNCCLPRSKII